MWELPAGPLELEQGVVAAGGQNPNPGFADRVYIGVQQPPHLKGASPRES